MYINTFSGLEQVSVNQGNRNSPEYVRWLQTSLNSTLGLNLKVDGIMGQQTRNAIRSFQQQQGLVADGIIGPKTETALTKATSATPSPAPPITVRTDTIKPANARLTSFDKDSAKLKDSHIADIDSVAEKIASSWKTGKPIFTVYAKGHTSSEGSAQYNVGLGNRRALAVRKALQKALERKQKNLSYKVLVLAQSKGEREPIDTNETENGRSQNRRVEIFLSTKMLLPLPKKVPPTPPKTDSMIPVIMPDLVTPKLPADNEPLCDLTSYEKEIQGYKVQTRSQLIDCALAFGLSEATAIGFAGSALVTAPTLVGLIVLAAAAGIQDTIAKVQLARCAFSALQRYQENVKGAKAKWHCL